MINIGRVMVILVVLVFLQPYMFITVQEQNKLDQANLYLIKPNIHQNSYEPDHTVQGIRPKTFATDLQLYTTEHLYDFKLYNVTVSVKDDAGNPIKGAFVKAFSPDWGIMYPHYEEWGLTDNNGAYKFKLASGNWILIASSGHEYSALYPGKGFYLTFTVLINKDTTINLKPNYSFKLEFRDNNDNILFVDSIYITDSSFIPIVPPVYTGTSNNGLFYLSLTSDMLNKNLIILGVKYGGVSYILKKSIVPSRDNGIISAKNYPKIVLTGYDEFGNISSYWSAWFRFPEYYAWGWGVTFKFSNMSIFYVPPTSIMINAFYSPPNWFYYFDDIGLILKENESFFHFFGGQGYFHLWVIKENTQLMFDIRDSFGNVVSYYSSNEKYAWLKIIEKGNVVFYDDIGSKLWNWNMYSLKRTFSDDATFELKVNLGPLGKLGVLNINGYLYSNATLVPYRDLYTKNFVVHLPTDHFFNVSGQVRTKSFLMYLEKVYDAMGKFLNENLNVKPHRVEVDFETVGVAWYNFIGIGLGIARWPFEVRPEYLYIMSWTLGIMYSATPPLIYYVECSLYCKPLATYLGTEALASLYGNNFRLWFWGVHPGIFDYIAGDKSVSETERMQTVFFYLHKVYGAEIHKQFIQLWANNTALKDKLMRKGFNVNETMIILYSYLAKENLAWLFQLAGYNVSENTVNSGLIIITDTTPPTTTHDYDGLWHTSDITIVLKANDDLSGVAETFYRINSGPVKKVSVDGQPVISTEGANNTLEYWSVDNAGNEEAHKILTGIKLDKTPPTGSITINEGRKYTNTTTVILTLLASDNVSGVAEMRFSNDNITWTPWEPFATVKSWVLEGSDGMKYVYVQFRDHANFVSQVYHATIILDTTSPVVNVVGLQIHDTRVTISWSGSDNISGIDHYEIRLNEGKWINVGANTSYTFENLTQRPHMIYIRAVDRAGNMNTLTQIVTVTQTTTVQTPATQTSPTSPTSPFTGLILVMIAVLVFISAAVFYFRGRKPATKRIRYPEEKPPPVLISEKEYPKVAKDIEETISKDVLKVQPRKTSILSIEATKLFVDEWGKIIVKVKGEGKASIKLEGDIEWKDPGSKELSGESIIEIPVKPKVSGDVPVKVIIDTPYGKEFSRIFLKVERKEIIPPQLITPIIEKVGLDEIIPLRNIPLKNLVSGYSCSGSKVFKVNFLSPTVPKEFEGAWECCLLGCGGWGCAYLCVRRNEKIVIKIPRGFEAIIENIVEAPTSHDAFLTKIRSEAEIMASLNHPNIIKLLGVSNKFPLVIYEFADYGSLYWQQIKGWKPSLKDVVLIGIQLGDALRYIHSRGLIHGDIKPSNVFIKDKIAKLGDFSSIVKLLSSVSISKMVYTIGFRAPEQVFSDIRRKSIGMGIENRIDIYQLGNLLLYILTGESVDGEEAINDKLVMEKLNNVPNEDLKQILAKTLAFEPEKRPSAEDLIKMLYIVWNKL
jgi:hypothetical protein